jgi:serine/threonine protein kinase
MAKSLVGTTMYMALEVLVGSFYDGRCDYWSLGVIFYEVWNFTFMREVIINTPSASSVAGHSRALPKSY